MAYENSPSIGLNRESGGTLTGWAHVLQSLDDLFTTEFGERIVREWYGSLIPALLGRNMNASELNNFVLVIAATIDQFEPRLAVKRIEFTEVTRTGHVKLTLELAYRPRAMLGDFTIEGTKKLISTIGGDGTIVLGGA